jgi:light-dependent protochlorophyllide reductase
MKTVIITGGNSGLGYACAGELVKDGNHQIILACRNAQKASDAVNKLQYTANSKNIEAMSLDLADMSSIRSFAAELAEKNLPLRAVICNAGVQFVRSQTYTKDGFDMTFGVNHLGHFLLINLLLAQLTTPARIILVSSDTHDSSKTTGMPEPYVREPQLMAYPQQDPTLKNKSIGELGRIAYTTSKLCNILCAYELSRRLQQQVSSITVNVFNPGLMPGSGLAQDYTASAKFVWNNILPILSSFVPNVNTPENAGKALARLVLDPKLDDITGKYFSGLKMIDSSQQTYDRVLAQQLWDGSVKLTQLKPQETILKLD